MKNTKNVYEALNEVDFDFEDYEKEVLSDMEKKKLKDKFNKNKRKRFNFKKVSSIVAASIITIGVLSQTGFGQNVYAGALSKLSEISYSIGYSLGIERDIESYVNVINQIVEDNGIEVKLTDVISDNLSSDQLNTLGNFIVAVGSLMLTKAAEIQALESQQDNSMAQMQQQIDQLQAALTKQMNSSK